MDKKVYAVEVHPNGSEFWYFNDKLHRENGPAASYASGDKYWFRNGVLHRTDGPAIEYASGQKAWYINGQWSTEEEHKMAFKKELTVADIEKLLGYPVKIVKE